MLSGFAKLVGIVGAVGASTISTPMKALSSSLAVPVAATAKVLAQGSSIPVVGGAAGAAGMTIAAGHGLSQLVVPQLSQEIAGAMRDASPSGYLA